MKALILAQTDYLVFPLIAVVLFVIVFGAALAWVYRPGSKEIYAARSRMVFSDEEGDRR